VENPDFLNTASDKSDGLPLWSHVFINVQWWRPVTFSSGMNNQNRRETVMFSEFSQGGLLKPIDNSVCLHMLDEADEFWHQRLAFNMVDIDRISSVNNVECIVLQLGIALHFKQKQVRSISCKGASSQRTHDDSPLHEESLQF
jgi:hypothetical protein